MQKRSSPTVWLGNPIKTVGTRLYYDACKFESTTYRVWDAVLLNSDFEPLPIGRIVSMWEQAKKKRLTIEWFYRGHDIVRATQEKGTALDDKEDDGDDRKRRKISDGSAQSISSSGRRVATQTLSIDADFKLGSPLKTEGKRCRSDSRSHHLDAAIAKVNEYINTKSDNEIFASSHKDDNYPSTLNCKVTVKHIDEIEDLDAYIAQGPKFLFFRKRIDLQTLELTDATSSLPSAEEAIDYDPKAARKRSQPVYPPLGVRPKKKSSRDEGDKRLSPRAEKGEKMEKSTITLNRSTVESRTRARQNLIDDSQMRIDDTTQVWGSLQSELFEFRKMTQDRLQSLERVMSDQQKQLSDQLQKIERQQKQNNDLYAQLQKQVNSSH